MRFAYTVLAYLLAPLLAGNYLARGWRERAYWADLPERLGFVPRAPGPALWIHAVSAGEVQASAPLVAELLGRHPELALLVTTATPAGRGRARALYPKATVCYLPIDLPGAVARFFRRARPALGVVLETELWPNLYAQAARRRVPIVLASARLSLKSVRRYARAASLVRQTLAGVTVGAQTEADAARFRELGAEPRLVSVTGNLKFDYLPRPALAAEAARWRGQLGVTRPIWVAGSTHAGEEEAVLAAHRHLRERFAEALLVLVPRHPSRFAAVEASLVAAGWVSAVRRSTGALPSTEGCAVLLLATLGELECAYASGDIAFVGGTLVAIGGHNLLEPAAAGRPVLFGPSFATAREMAAILLGAGGARVVADAGELGESLVQWFESPATRLAAGRAAAAAASAHRGAAAKVAELVEPKLREAGLAGRGARG